MASDTIATDSHHPEDEMSIMGSDTEEGEDDSVSIPDETSPTPPEPERTVPLSRNGRRSPSSSSSRYVSTNYSQSSKRIRGHMWSSPQRSVVSRVIRSTYGNSSPTRFRSRRPPIHMRLGRRVFDRNQNPRFDRLRAPFHRFDHRRHRRDLVTSSNSNRSIRRSEQGGHDKICTRAFNEIYELKDRINAQRVSDMFGAAHQTLTLPIPNGGFRPPADSAWMAALEFGKDHFTQEGRRVTWETLMLHGHELYRLFEIRAHASESARALRSLVLRGEGLLEALASADETITWCKMCAEKNLRLRPQDPILATTSAVLENLKLKLAPVMCCYLRSSGSPSLEELCATPRLSDVTCVPTFMFITLARLARAVELNEECIPYDVISGSSRVLAEYTPGTCLAGVLEAIDLHRGKCDNTTCRLTCGYTTTPLYMHGKYFYCNSLF
ncbi:multifunctional expression regulator [Felid alphaherpesvirus 1]|uniref:Multifunctional expression regulator n=1 Tax=Feline herpesvirus 1 TaxID=10334 RepID=D1FXS7_FHV1|nr:multifunctional expression regulator [Felid alphaherpesvirus 1]AMN88935.1 multifunctional expression regulator [synthetic construct]ACT88303.1 multifunctional expression regulator [Felid alphaherpesvirus 1]ALJ84087.1 multifunctional expression regulator [Felid alphaherpesvirus 1]ALJ84163.1 multifunctional expression regulator [Felid alphaherpesvirus 1]ALJ84239.1 multifunctional expression regulator [Felid alphaherpesvirus 1]